MFGGIQEFGNLLETEKKKKMGDRLQLFYRLVSFDADIRSVDWCMNEMTQAEQQEADKLFLSICVLPDHTFKTSMTSVLAQEHLCEIRNTKVGNLKMLFHLI